MTEIHNHARYRQITGDNGKPMQAVFRFQEAQSSKTCELDHCPLGGRILPYQKYARVFYEDVNEVEIFHVACFEKEFGDGNNRF